MLAIAMVMIFNGVYLYDLLMPYQGRDSAL